MLPLAHQTPKLFYCPKSFLLVYLRANLRFNSVSVYPPIALFVWVTLLFLHTIYFYLPVTLFACDSISVSILSTYNYIYPYLILSVFHVCFYLSTYNSICLRVHLHFTSVSTIYIFLSSCNCICLRFCHCLPSISTFYRPIYNSIYSRFYLSVLPFCFHILSPSRCNYISNTFH